MKNIFEHIRNLFSSPSYPRTLALVGILIIIIALPVTIFVLQQRTNLQQHASSACSTTCDAQYNKCYANCDQNPNQPLTCYQACNRQYNSCLSSCTTAPSSCEQNTPYNQCGQQNLNTPSCPLIPSDHVVQVYPPTGSCGYICLDKGLQTGQCGYHVCTQTSQTGVCNGNSALRCTKLTNAGGTCGATEFINCVTDNSCIQSTPTPTPTTSITCSTYQGGTYRCTNYYQNKEQCGTSIYGGSNDCSTGTTNTSDPHYGSVCCLKTNITTPTPAPSSTEVKPDAQVIRVINPTEVACITNNICPVLENPLLFGGLGTLFCPVVQGLLLHFNGLTCGAFCSYQFPLNNSGYTSCVSSCAQGVKACLGSPSESSSPLPSTFNCGLGNSNHAYCWNGTSCPTGNQYTSGDYSGCGTYALCCINSNSLTPTPSAPPPGGKQCQTDGGQCYFRLSGCPVGSTLKSSSDCTSPTFCCLGLPLLSESPAPSGGGGGGSNPPPVACTPGQSTSFALAVKLQGIGSGTFENNTPLHPTRTAAYVRVTDESGTKLYDQGNIQFTYSNGTFNASTIDLGTSATCGHTYTVTVKLPMYVKVSNAVTYGSTTQTVNLNPIPGDLVANGNSQQYTSDHKVIGDDVIDPSDYNIIKSCHDDPGTTLSLTNNTATVLLKCPDLMNLFDFQDGGIGTDKNGISEFADNYNLWLKGFFQANGFK